MECYKRNSFGNSTAKAISYSTPTQITYTLGSKRWG